MAGSTRTTTDTSPPGPREVFGHLLRGWTGEAAGLDTFDHLLADDAVVEAPFAPPGRPRRCTGRSEFLAFARPARAALPVRFEQARATAVHDTADPATIVVEYELTGTATATNRRTTAPFIAVLTVRDGKIARWREYQDTAAIAAALSGTGPEPPPAAGG